MKLILAAVLTLMAAGAPANEVEMMLVPKASAEALVMENLRQQQELEQQRDWIIKQQKQIEKLQSSTNCV